MLNSCHDFVGQVHFAVYSDGAGVKNKIHSIDQCRVLFFSYAFQECFIAAQMNRDNWMSSDAENWLGPRWLHFFYSSFTGDTDKPWKFLKSNKKNHITLDTFSVGDGKNAVVNIDCAANGLDWIKENQRQNIAWSAVRALHVRLFTTVRTIFLLTKNIKFISKEWLVENMKQRIGCFPKNYIHTRCRPPPFICACNSIQVECYSWQANQMRKPFK